MEHLLSALPDQGIVIGNEAQQVQLGGQFTQASGLGNIGCADHRRNLIPPLREFTFEFGVVAAPKRFFGKHHVRAGRVAPRP
jgi:hypothetical protein